jgi:hypothetical protein
LTEVKNVREITDVIPTAELEKLCSLEQHFQHVDETFRDVGL